MSKLILLSFCAFGLSGCFHHRQKKSRSQIDLVLSDEPPQLHPRKANDHISGALLRLCHEGLMCMKEDGTSEPGLAQKHTVSEDGTVYTFAIRSDAKWSNGDLITACDFERAWKKILDPDLIGGGYHEQLFCIKNAKAFHERKVHADRVGIYAEKGNLLKVVLEQPTPYFLDLISFFAFFPVHAKADAKDDRWAENAGSDYICSGPFRLAQWKHQNEIALEKNSHYWRAEDTKIEKIRFSIVKDANTCLNMFERDEIDLMGSSPYGELPCEALENLRGTCALQSMDITTTSWCAVNTKHPLLCNKNIRKALALAIDRRAIAQNIVSGMCTPTTHLLPAQLRADQKPLFGDGDGASAGRYFKRGLDELGATVEQFNKLRLSFDSKSSHQKIMQAIQQQWRTVLGIDVILEPQERKLFLNRTQNRDFDLAREQWNADYFDASTFLEIFRYAHMGNNNDTWWESIDYAQILDRAQLEQNRERRQALMEKAERVIADELPIIPLFHQTNNLLINPRLKNVKQTVLGPLEMRSAYLID